MELSFPSACSSRRSPSSKYGETACDDDNEMMSEVDLSSGKGRPNTQTSKSHGFRVTVRYE